MSTSQIPPGLAVGLVTFDEPTLLFLTNGSSSRWLAQKIQDRTEVLIDGCRSEDNATDLRLTILPVDSSPTEMTRLGDEIAWRISREDADYYAQQLRALAGSAGPAHTYLDSASTIGVMISKGEYDSATIFS